MTAVGRALPRGSAFPTLHDNRIPGATFSFDRADIVDVAVEGAPGRRGEAYLVEDLDQSHRVVHAFVSVRKLCKSCQPVLRGTCGMDRQNIQRPHEIIGAHTSFEVVLDVSASRELRCE